MRTSLTRRHFFGLAAGASALAACSAPEQQPPASSALPSLPPATTSPRSTAAPTSAAPSGPATEVARATSGRPELALTFHGAGDPTITRQVLDLVRQHNAHITVLAVGTWLAEHPDAARMVRDGGHELGNHTWSHPALAGYKPEPMLAEIERCRDKLAEVTGTPGTFFRQSQGQHATAQ